MFFSFGLLTKKFGVCVVPNIYGAGFWWVTPKTGSPLPLPTEDLAWRSAFNVLVAKQPFTGGIAIRSTRRRPK